MQMPCDPQKCQNQVGFLITLSLILLNLFFLGGILTEIVKSEQSRRLKFNLNRKKNRTDQNIDDFYDAHITEIKTKLISFLPDLFFFFRSLIFSDQGEEGLAIPLPLAKLQQAAHKILATQALHTDHRKGRNVSAKKWRLR